MRAASGEWTANGRIAFPIRSCYPQVALAGGAGHVLAMGDIVEPVEEYREYKREQTGRAWDYVFQRLFYTHSPRLTDQPFGPPLEVANVEATGGHIQNLDLWIDDDGVAHLLHGDGARRLCQIVDARSVRYLLRARHAVLGQDLAVAPSTPTYLQRLPRREAPHILPALA